MPEFDVSSGERIVDQVEAFDDKSCASRQSLAIGAVEEEDVTVSVWFELLGFIY